MEEISYTLIRSARRTIALQVERDGSVVVRAPRPMAKRDIDAFLARKADWLAQALAKVKAQAAQRPVLAVADGASLLWLGGELVLKLEARREAKRAGEVLLLPGDAPEKALEAWARREARSWLAGRLRLFSTRMGVSPRGLKITGARTRWGSCTGRDSLNFTWRLMLCPPELIDYVVVHELAHIRQKNHSPAFWAEVEALLPDWRERRAALNGRQYIMDFL